MQIQYEFQKLSCHFYIIRSNLNVIVNLGNKKVCKLRSISENIFIPVSMQNEIHIRKQIIRVRDYMFEFLLFISHLIDFSLCQFWKQKKYAN